LQPNSVPELIFRPSSLVAVEQPTVYEMTVMNLGGFKDSLAYLPPFIADSALPFHLSLVSCDCELRLRCSERSPAWIRPRRCLAGGGERGEERQQHVELRSVLG
jgi:hypothetical protein